MTTGFRHSCRKVTLCENLRRINDLVQGQHPKDKEIRKLLSECEDMAKRMSIKLKKYNKHYDAAWWKDNPEYEKDLDRRLRTKYITDE